MDNLKPCPFCGNEKLREGQGDMYFIECEPCYDNFGTNVCAEGAARHDAVAMWNRRSRQESPSERSEAELPFKLPLGLATSWDIDDAHGVHVANCTQSSFAAAIVDALNLQARGQK